jgi:Na+/proline symporter
VGSGKTELEGRVGYTYGTMIKRFCAMGWVFTGIILAGLAAQGKVSADRMAQLSEHRELAFGTAMEALLPTGLLGLMFAAIFASQMATLSAQMVNSSALASRNLYKEWIRPKAPDKEVLLVGRFCGLFLVAIGVSLAFALQRVATALTMLLGFASIMGVVVWGGVLWRRTTAKGAWAAVIVLFLIWSALGPFGMVLRNAELFRLPGWIGMYGHEKYLSQLMIRALPAGIAVLVLVSLFTRPHSRKQVDDFFMLLKTPVGQEQKLIDAGVNIIYAGSVEPNALELKHPHLVHWGGFAFASAMCLGILGLLYFLANIGT